MFTTVTFMPRRLLVALSVLTVAVAVGACGSSVSSSSSAAAGAGSGTTAGSTTARLNLAKCFRAHGINVSDSGSTTGGGGGGAGSIFSALRNYPRAKVQAAETACKQYLAAAFPAANLTAAQRAQRTQELVKYAECMRSHGVNIPDPTTSGGGPGGGGFGFGAGGGSGGTNFRSQLNTPAFKTANAACASLRPSFGRAGATGATGTSGA
ncbi:MAG: hypothetical protein ACLP01_01360 [Solirubrobacteraceae bacterium]